MQVTTAETTVDGAPGPEEPLAWLEDDRGSIARGVVTLLSKDGAHIRLAEAGSIEPGDEVDVRLSLDRATPSVAGTGTVLWTQEADDAIECEIEWTHSGPDRAQLEKLVAERG